MRLKTLLLTLVICLLVAPVADAAKSYGADRFDVDMTIMDDGSILVTETVVFRFVGGPFTTVFRDLVADETDGIDEIAASMDGRSLPSGTGPGQVEIKNGPTASVIWHFEPTSDAVHTFVLSYRMLGVIRQQSDADVLSFRAIPSEHDYDIASSTLRVTFPAKARLTATPSVRKGSAAIETGPTQVVFRSGPIKDDRTLQVALNFERGSLISAPPQWQARRMQQDERAPIWIGVALATLVAGALALSNFWRKHARTSVSPQVGALRIMRPPSDLPPALAGMLKDDSADAQWSQALGTMLDLARRGALVIEELAQRHWGQRDFTVLLAAIPPDLRPHEEALIKLFFTTKKGKVEIPPGVGDVVKISDLQSRIGSHWKLFADPLKDEMRAAGLFDAERERVRRQFVMAATMVLVASTATFVAGLALLGTFGGWVMLTPIALFVVSMAAYVASYAYSPLSDAAVHEQPRWKGFADYLKAVAKGTEPFVGARLLEDYLPYAASFGQAEGWAKLFKQREGEDVLGWFRPLAAADGGSAAFVAMMTATSSAGGSDGAGGAGGASGAAGGASGAAGGGASGAH